MVHLSDPPPFTGLCDRVRYVAIAAAFGSREAVFRQHMRYWRVTEAERFGLADFGNCLGLWIGPADQDRRADVVDEIAVLWPGDAPAAVIYKRLYVAIFRHMERTATPWTSLSQPQLRLLGRFVRGESLPSQSPPGTRHNFLCARLCA